MSEQNPEALLDATVKFFLTAGEVRQVPLLKHLNTMHKPFNATFDRVESLFVDLEKRKLIGRDPSNGWKLLVNAEQWEAMKGARTSVPAKSFIKNHDKAIAVPSEQPAKEAVSCLASPPTDIPVDKHALAPQSKQTEFVMIKITDIIIGKRHRKDYGDIPALAKSMEDEGVLIQSIALTPTKELICGERRILAAILLKWTHIPACIIDVKSIVRGEHDENVQRKNFTISEMVDIAQALEADLPKERRGRNNAQNIGQFKGLSTAQIAAEAAGFGNAETYRQAAKVVKDGTPPLVKAMDTHEASPGTAAAIATLPPEQQNAVVAAGPDAMKTVAAKQLAVRKAAKKRSVAPAVDQVTPMPAPIPNGDASPETLSDHFKRLGLVPVKASSELSIVPGMIFIMDQDYARRGTGIGVAKLLKVTEELGMTQFITPELLKLSQTCSAKSAKSKPRKTKGERDHETEMKMEAEAGG